MVRVMTILCIALMGFSILALYHVSEATRVTQVRLDRVNRTIAETRGQIGVLQIEWQHVAGPARVQQLAERQLGMSDTSSLLLSSFDQLPRRGQDPAPLGNTPLHNASVVVAAPPAPPDQPSDQSSGQSSGM